MSLPKFFPRIENAITPLLSAEADLEEFLSEKAVSLRIPEDISQHPFHVAGFMLLVNLCARLYPKIAVLGPAKVVEEARH